MRAQRPNPIPPMRLLTSFILGACLVQRAVGFVASSSDIDQQLAQAVLVADVNVVRTDSVADPTYYAAFHADAEVLNVVSARDDGGWFPRIGEHIAIEGLGGEVNQVGVLISGYPRPRTGIAYRVFLKRGAGMTFQITGFEKGLTPLHPTRNYSRNRTDGSNGEGNGPFLFWDDTFFPIPYYISAPSFKGRQEFVMAIDASFKTWRDIEDIRVEFLPNGCTTSQKNENEGINTVVLITRDWPFDPVAIAITRNFYVAGDSPKAGLILDSDIMLNAVNHQFTTSNEVGKHDVQNIVTHEVGHFLGLGHEVSPVDPDSTMFAVASPNETKKRNLHTDDLAGIHSAYNGVGNKYKIFTTPSCMVSDGNVGCAAVHHSARTPVDLVWVTMFLAILILVGRMYWQNVSRRW
jgi:hypothetical protein